jgi:hypothetical protein
MSHIAMVTALLRFVRANRVALTATAGAMLVLGCGISQPKYINYTDDGTGTAPGTVTSSAECIAAQAAFDAQVEPAIKSTCAKAGCHLTQTVAGGLLSVDNTAANRTRLKAYSGGDVDTLFNKISLKAGSHGGGDVSTNLPKANISAWLDKEAACK